jgi:Raf kinase inhibitor-like YbhB/YbcL family protein
MPHPMPCRPTASISASLMRPALAVVAIAFLLCPFAVRAHAASEPVPVQRPQMTLRTDAFEDGARMPGKYTGLQAPSGVSPALSWQMAPSGTQSFVLLMHDTEEAPNRSSRMDATHWLLWNIPGSATGLPEAVPEGAQLLDGTRQVSQHSNGYRGPGPNPGANHHYVFELFALDIKLEVPVGVAADAVAIRKAIFDAMDGHVIAKASLVGRSALIPPSASPSTH